jgi:hypothetical protein
MQWHVQSVKAPERLCRQAMEEEEEGGAHLPRLLSFSLSLAAPPAGRANKAMQWPMRPVEARRGVHDGAMEEARRGGGEEEGGAPLPRLLLPLSREECHQIGGIRCRS